MRTPLIITAVAGLAVAIGIGAVIATGGDPDSDLQPVAADVDAAPEPVRITAARPAARAPIGTVIDSDSLNAPDRPEEADDERRERGPRGDRDRRGGERMDPSEFAERFQSRRARMQEMMDRYDTDGDGVLSDAEREVLREAMRERGRQRMLERMTERFDADGDGELSEEERLEAEAEMEARRIEWQIRMTERFDTDGDGQVSDAERDAAREQFRRDRGQADEQMLQRYDADGDGELNLDESYAAYLDRFDARERERFVRDYDSSADGSVDASDLESFLTRYREADPSTDVNGDGIINQLDVDRFRDLMMTQSQGETLPDFRPPGPPGGFGGFGGGERRGGQRDQTPSDSGSSTDTSSTDTSTDDD